MCNCGYIWLFLYTAIAVVSYIGWMFYLGLILEKGDYEKRGWLDETSQYVFSRNLGAFGCIVWPITIVVVILFMISKLISEKSYQITKLGQRLKKEGKEEND